VPHLLRVTETGVPNRKRCHTPRRWSVYDKIQAAGRRFHSLSFPRSSVGTYPVPLQLRVSETGVPNRKRCQTPRCRSVYDYVPTHREWERSDDLDKNPSLKLTKNNRKSIKKGERTQIVVEKTVNSVTHVFIRWGKIRSVRIEKDDDGISTFHRCEISGNT